MKVVRYCAINGKFNTMEIPSLTPKILDEIMRKKSKGALIQNAAPFLNPEEREFLLTGTTPDLWNETFREPEE